MAKLTEKEARRARRLLKVIDEFRKLDPDMQMPMAATFLLVALNEGISRTEVMERLSVAGSTATRNLMGLMEQGRLGRAGHGLVDQVVNPDERRWRMHYLSPKGRLVLKSMLSMLDGVDEEDGEAAQDGPRPPAKRRSARLRDEQASVEREDDAEGARRTGRAGGSLSGEADDA